MALVQTVAPDRIGRHLDILSRKRMIREVFNEFHHTMRALDDGYFGNTPGLRVELGAGAGPIRDSYPDVLSTDIVAAPHLDRVIDATAMDFGDAAVRVLYAQNCFHHFPDPAAFFQEVERVVHPGGGVVLIEPYFGPLASFVYPRLFAFEDFDKRMLGWKANISNVNEANQALSYIVFKRDRAIFEDRFSNLRLIHEKPLTNYVRYVLSGGLNFPQLAPNGMISLLRVLEKLASPLAGLFALHHVIVLRRV